MLKLMVKTKEKPEPKASKIEPGKSAGKATPKKRIPKPKKENIIHPSFEKHCSYCGKPSTQAKVLIAGPPPLFPYICDECIEICVKVLMEEGLPDWRSRIIGILAIQAEPKKTPPKQSEIKPSTKKKVVKAND